MIRRDKNDKLRYDMKIYILAHITMIIAICDKIKQHWQKSSKTMYPDYLVNNINFR